MEELTVDKLINDLGGVSRAASALGRSHSTICDWKRERLIPASVVRRIHEVTGVSAERLLLITRKEKAAA